MCEFSFPQKFVAMRNYIHRKAVIGYHKTNYLNIVRCMERFLQLNKNDKAEVEKWKEQVAAEVVLTEKKWFLGLLPMKERG